MNTATELSTLERAFETLDRYAGRIPVDVLEAWLEEAELTLDRLRPFVRFHPERYLRNLVRNGPAYQALLLCWRSGQRSPIHDHAGSNCAVKVLHGEAAETTFARAAGGMIYPTATELLRPGGIVASADADIHQVSNLQAGDDLITLHVYSPPLSSMNSYSLLDASVSRILEPINDEFLAGAGI